MMRGISATVLSVLAIAGVCFGQAGAAAALRLVAEKGCGAAMPGLASQFNAAQFESTAQKTTAKDAHRLVGLALLQCRTAEKQWGEAAVLGEQLGREFPQDADVLFAVADLHRKAWNDTVYQMYRKTPASFRVNQLSAELFEMQGRYAEAAGEYEKAIAKSPKTVNLHYRLGRALLLESHERGSLQKAQKAFAAELELNPADAAAEYQVAQIYQLEGDTAQAGPHFEKALALRPDFPEALIAVARLRGERKDLTGAVSLLERAVALQPASETAHYNLMMAYRRAGRTAEAQREKALIEKLQKPPEGEFTEFLKRLGEKTKP